MQHVKRNSILAAFFVVVLVGLVGFSWHRAQAADMANEGDLAAETAVTYLNTHHLQYDIAEIGTRFVYDEAPVFEDDFPAYGNPFITEGYIYAAGTLGESDGVLPNGEPEFPDQVLGKWVCRGYFIGDGAHTTTGPWVITTQVFDLGDAPGEQTIVTEGFELSDIGVAGDRAITGGTGHYSRARGQMMQTLIGFNETMGVNLQVELNVNR